MEFPPTSWFVFPASDFETAPARNPGDIGMEIMAQMRPNGRVMDHWRVALGGSKCLEMKIPLASILPAAATWPKWHLFYQMWPKDVEIRRNMSASAWCDVGTLLGRNEILVFDDKDEAVPAATVIAAMEATADPASKSASWRWAVAVSDAGRMELQLQSLPSPAAMLNGKPMLKR